jgi:hypothetical protein
MQKGETAISIALAAVVVLAYMAIHQRWQVASLREMASSAQEFILTTTGLRGEVPELVGYEKVKTYPLGQYRGALYRASPAPLIFAPGRFVIYDARNRPVFRLETLEGSREPWTTVYDFAGRNGLPVPRSRARPVFTRDLTGGGNLHALIGQYSGGDHCCTTVSVVELGPAAVKVIGRISGLDGLPFEGLELVKANPDPAWELLARRPYPTACGPHRDSAEIPAIYGFVEGEYRDETARHLDYLQGVLRANLGKWAKQKEKSLQTLLTLGAQYALLGQREEGKRFVAMNLGAFVPELQKRGIDPNACIDDATAMLDRLAIVVR